MTATPNHDVALDGADITVFRDITFLAAGPASERSRPVNHALTLSLQAGCSSGEDVVLVSMVEDCFSTPASVQEIVMPFRVLLFASVVLLGVEGPLRASEEELLRWSEVRIVGVEREDTGKVVFSAKTAGEKYQDVTIEAFGKQFPVAKEDLPKLNGLPLNSLAITHEAGYERLGGHTVHFKMKVVYYDKAGRLIEERAALSVSRGKGLTISERNQHVLKESK
jgi:hypothetical protein